MGSALERLERALRLCCFFRKNTDFRDEFDQLSAHLLAEYERTREQGDSPYPLRLLQLDIDCKVSEPSFIAQELLFLTKNYLAQKLFHLPSMPVKPQSRLRIGAVTEIHSLNSGGFLPIHIWKSQNSKMAV